MSGYKLPDGNIVVNKAKFVLTQAGLEAVKAKFFEEIEPFESDSPLYYSQLGTPVFDDLQIIGGSYIDNQDNVISYEGIRVPTVLFQVNQVKNIVKTSVQGRNGTFKEYVSDGDFEITATGIIASNSNAFPEQDVKALIEIMKVPDRINIVSRFLNIFGITHVVVNSYTLPQQAGYRNIQAFEIQFSSDTSTELELDEETSL